jgi:hypothetical protein
METVIPKWQLPQHAEFDDANVPVFAEALKAASDVGYELTYAMIEELAELMLNVRDWCDPGHSPTDGDKEYIVRVCENLFMEDPTLAATWRQKRIHKKCRKIIVEKMQAKNLTFRTLWSLLAEKTMKVYESFYSPYRNSRKSVPESAEEWVILAGSHAAMGQGDEQFAAWLQDYLLGYPKLDEASSNLVRQQKTADEQGYQFPGLFYSLEYLDQTLQKQDYYLDHTSAFFSVLSHYYRLGQYAVDIFRNSFNGFGLDASIADEGYCCAKDATIDLLKDPHSGIPCYASGELDADEIRVSMDAKEVIARSNFLGDIDFLMSIVASFKERGDSNTELGWEMYHFLFDAVAQWKDEKIREDFCKVMVWCFRPVPMVESTNNFRLPGSFYEELIADDDNLDFEFIVPELTDVELEPYGPRIYPDTYGIIVTAAPAGMICTYCQYELEDDEESNLSTIIKLTTCGHKFHGECIDEWINGEFKGKDMVGCPCCRADICAPRPLRLSA